MILRENLIPAKSSAWSERPAGELALKTVRFFKVDNILFLTG